MPKLRLVAGKKLHASSPLIDRRIGTLITQRKERQLHINHVLNATPRSKCAMVEVCQRPSALLTTATSVPRAQGIRWRHDGQDRGRGARSLSRRL
jgi:hypothetical protein